MQNFIVHFKYNIVERCAAELTPGADSMSVYMQSDGSSWILNLRTSTGLRAGSPSVVETHAHCTSHSHMIVLTPYPQHFSQSIPFECCEITKKLEEAKKEGKKKDTKRYRACTLCSCAILSVRFAIPQWLSLYAKQYGNNEKASSNRTERRAQSISWQVLTFFSFALIGQRLTKLSGRYITRIILGVPLPVFIALPHWWLRYNPIVYLYCDSSVWSEEVLPVYFVVPIPCEIRV